MSGFLGSAASHPLSEPADGSQSRSPIAKPSQVAVCAGLGPGLAPVIGAKHAAVIGFDQGPDALGTDRRHRNANNANRCLRQSFVLGDFAPVFAAIGAFPKARPRAAALKT